MAADPRVFTGLPDLIRREGLTVIHDPVDCEIDLVIVHGLNGSPHKTFYDASTGFYWPSDLGRCLPTTRIMVFGYIADVSGGSSNPLGVYQHAESLLLHLKNNRVGLAENRPIALIGHSLGGIVIKQALVLSSHRLADEQLLRSTKLICFLGTPHRGSHLLDKSFSKMGLSVMKLASKEVPKNVKNALQPRANESFIMNTEFMRVKGQIPIVNFYEQVPRYPLNELVVDKDSAVLDSEYSENIPVARDHEHLVRFDSANDNAYHTLCQTLQRKISKVLEEVSTKEKDGYSQHMLQACLRSLGDLGIPTSLTETKEAHHETLTWLWAPEGELRSWLDNGRGLFAVTGKPGSGKSLLMNEVASQIRKKHRGRFPIIVQHAFSNRGTPRQRSLDGFLRLAIGQILRQSPSAFDSMLDEFLCVAYESGFTSAEIYNADTVDRITWQISGLKRALRAIVSHASQKAPFCFIIDALDECEGGKDGLVELVGFLETVRKAGCTPASNDAVRICFSCRDLPIIAGSVASSGFRMEERNAPDIAAYINDRWLALSVLTESSDEMKSLKGELIQKADGIFLWAHLALERIQAALSDGATVAELREAIDDIPEELGGLFALLLGSINPRYAAEASTMLAIVLCAQRPLSLAEFRCIMALNADPTANSHKVFMNSQNIVQDDASMRRRIQSRCGGLLEVKAVEGERVDEDRFEPARTYFIQFIHQSVKEYLLSSQQTPGVETLDGLTVEGHKSLSRTCIRYLSLKEAQELATQIRTGSSLDKPSRLSRGAELPLLRYAAEFCFYHCEEAEKKGVLDAELLDRHFGADDESFENYLSLYNAIHRGKKYSQEYSLLHLAVESNLATYVEMRLSHSADDINVLLEENKSYVQVATWKKHQETLRVLLKYGADINRPHHQSCYEMPYKAPYKDLPPLVLACRNGSVEIVHMLLEKGADVAGCTMHVGGLRANQALLSATYAGKIEIVQLLLDAEPAALSHPEIRLSAMAGLSDYISDLSWERRGDVQERNESLEANLQMIRQISQLVFQGVDLFQLDFELMSAGLFWFLTGCHPEVLQRLVDLGTDFSGAGSMGLSFMHAACMQGNEASVQILLRNHADPHITFGEAAKTCLHMSLLNGTTGVLSHLLKIGLPVDEPDLSGNTALHDAARTASDEFIEVLLRHGADKSLFNGAHCRPFHRAIYNRTFKDRIGILEKLLYEEADINLPDREGLTALHVAAGRGAMPVVEWLLSKGADTTALASDGRSVLHMAASSQSLDSTDVLGRLLGHEGAPEVNARDSADMTALHHVLWTYRSLERDIEFDPAVTVANVQLLLQRGADVTARDNAGNTVLHLAAWRGFRPLVRELLRNGADPKAEDLNGLRPLDLASMEDVRELLEDAMLDTGGANRAVLGS